MTDLQRIDLHRLEAYYDAVPRTAARAETHGPFTLFVQEDGGWPYYARPTVGAETPITAADVTRVRDRQRELGIPETFEWVGEITPDMQAAATEAGLVVRAHPILILDELVEAPLTPGVRRMAPDDPELTNLRKVQNVGFGTPGTAVGAAGTAERDAAAADPSGLTSLRKRLAAGTTVAYAAFGSDGLLAAGMHQPVGAVTEIVGVATLPAARRRGLGAAVTRALAADALAAGAEVVFLSAGDEDVARLYESIGFRRVATALNAEPAGHPGDRNAQAST